MQYIVIKRSDSNDDVLGKYQSHFEMKLKNTCKIVILEELPNNVSTDSQVYFLNLEYFSNDYTDIFELLRVAIQKRIKFVFLQEKIEFDGGDQDNSALTPLDFLVALRQKRKTRRVGRPKGKSNQTFKLDSEREIIFEHIRKRVSFTTTVRVLGCSYDTLASWCKRNNINFKDPDSLPKK